MFELTLEEIKLIITLYKMQYENGNEPQKKDGYNCIEKLKEWGYIGYAENIILKAGYPLQILYICWNGVRLEEKGRKTVEIVHEVAGDINDVIDEHVKTINVHLRKYEEEIKGITNINIENVGQFNQNNGSGTIIGG